MINQHLKFTVHNSNLAPSYSVPAVDQYESQKKIQVVSKSDSLAFNVDYKHAGHHSDAAENNFFALRLEMALGLAAVEAPSYFPGAIIPGPGGAACAELWRGNLMFEQFKYLLQFDGETAARLSQYSTSRYQSLPRPSRLFSCEVAKQESWLWEYIDEPRLYFLHQARCPDSQGQDQQQALANLASVAATLLDETYSAGLSAPAVRQLLSLINDAWFAPISSTRPIKWSHETLAQISRALALHKKAITRANLLPFLFELEALASHLSLSERSANFARGVFAGNFIEVAMAPITTMKATEFCVRERLFDELINLSSRGFAPVVINEYGLVSDGNHRLTASYVWNVLKYCQDLEWCMDNSAFQKRVAGFAVAVKNGLLKQQTGTVSAVSLHEALNHLSYFLCRPDWRSRLISYTKPLLKRHDFIDELPVIVLPEYLSGAVVKANYDDGIGTERACPSIYEAMYLNDHLVLPPRASYHFTDAALLPWFTVLKNSCGTKRKTCAYGPRATGKARPNRRIQN